MSIKLCVVTAGLGNFDIIVKPLDTSMPFDYYMFTDKNFPPRFNSMTPRLQSKIPKFFAWQLVPDYDYYLWIDGNITLKEGAIKYLYEQCKDYDMVVFKHFIRPDIRQETRYTRKGVRQKAIYLHRRYENEQYNEAYDEILLDKSYKDNKLFMGGVFIYKDTAKVREMFKNWWYFNSRYTYQDQISFPYVVSKADLNVNVLQENMMESPYFEFKYHTRKQ